MAYTLAGISLDVPETEICTKSSGMFKSPMPGKDSSESIAIDLMGAERTIRLTGTFVKADVATLATTASSLLALVTGAQATISYVSDLFGTVTVKVGSITLNWDKGTTTVLKYDIELFEAKAGV